MLFGVCAGFAEYVDADPTLIRLAYALISLVTGVFPGIVLYVIAAIIMPEKKKK